jgi:hypothetical protein
MTGFNKSTPTENPFNSGMPLYFSNAVRASSLDAYDRDALVFKESVDVDVVLATLCIHRPLKISA